MGIITGGFPALFSLVCLNDTVETRCVLNGELRCDGTRVAPSASENKIGFTPSQVNKHAIDAERGERRSTSNP